MTTSIEIEGMHCPACVKRLTTQLQKVPGVRAANVTLSPPRAQIETTGPVAMEALADAVRAAGSYKIRASSDVPAPASTSESAVATRAIETPKPSLYPLVLIVCYIVATTALATYARGAWSWHSFLNDFMAGFFLVFSFFKLLDLHGFADAYQSYDILARRWRTWALAYPFIELALGIAYLVRWQPMATNAITLVLMLVGSVGVLRAVLDKLQIRCACLGTALNLPMTTVTLVEDLGMAAMAAAMLVWRHG